MPTQIFLGDEIIGPNVADAPHRTFQRCDINKDPSYSRKFFESAPTIWACAYELEKLIETYLRPPAGTQSTLDNDQAVEEWMCLFVFYYFGIANLEIFQKSVFVTKDAPTPTYDPDLWSALFLTYPPGELSEIALVRLNDDKRTVLGASYPGIVFFPGRGRSAWKASADLDKYLSDNKLSWDKCAAELLNEPDRKSGFAKFLADVKATVAGDCGEAITKFSQAKGIQLPANGTTFKLRYPYQQDSGWTRAIVEDPDKIIERYPLVKEIKDTDGRVTKRVYFLVTSPADVNGQRENGMPDTDWTVQAIDKGMPTPKQFYLKKDASGRLQREHIFIKWAGKELNYEVKSFESVVLLNDCFLTRPAYWCQTPQDDKFNANVRAEHLLTNSNQSPVLNVQANGNSYHLAPVNETFLEHFGFDLYKDSENQLIKITKVSLSSGDIKDAEGSKPGIDWIFNIEVGDRSDAERKHSLTLKWSGQIEKRELEDVSAAIWPPRVHKDWRLYFAYGRGSGAWRLFDENGQAGAAKTKNEEFLSTSGEEDDRKGIPNRPAALMLFETDNKSRGVFFLRGLVEVGAIAGDADVGFDFGTSNTCLAFKLSGAPRAQAQVLRFTLTPKMVWGRTPAELPGFVPFRWHAKDFFSTILMSDAGKQDLAITQAGVTQAANIKPSDLFLDVDIPTLHRGLKEALALGRFAQSWNIHHDLKWKQPAVLRDLFLSLTLLYAHAELLFNEDYRYKVSKCVFTYPLAFDNSRLGTFTSKTRDVYQRVYQMCYAKPPQDHCGFMNESEAVAASQSESEANVDLFIDIGGGSTDIAVSYPKLGFNALDSVELAGNKFFELIWQHFSGNEPSNKQLRRDLNLLLSGQKQELNITKEIETYLEKIGGLGSYYSFLISERDPSELTESEQQVREVGTEYYQHFRSRWFYEHILTYGLIQACAAALGEERLPGDIRILCTGNGWGMLTLAKWEKTKQQIQELAEGILDLLKDKLRGRHGVSEDRLNSLQIGEIAFVGEEGSSSARGIRYTAKSAVACGAIDSDGHRSALAGEYSSFTGVTLDKITVGDEFVGAISVASDWKDRWRFKSFADPLKKETNSATLMQIDTFEFTVKDKSIPFDPLLGMFFNTYQLEKSWVERMWRDLNDMTLVPRAYTAQSSKMSPSPLNRFLAEALYGKTRSNLRDLAAKLGKL
jgi:hypothetical protein